jgi:PAS domain S-box-containing protein
VPGLGGLAGSTGQSRTSYMSRNRYCLPVALGAVVLVGLYLISQRNYVLFHSLAEMFSIVIAFCIFIIAWNSRRVMENSYLLFLGIAYVFVGGIDLIHTLAYPGMGVFPGTTTDLPTQLWIGARCTESLSLILAPIFLGRRLKVELVLLAYAVISAGFIGSIFYWDVFPTCFIEGHGLTAFKKISEYGISFVLLGSIMALVRRREHFDAGVLRLLIASILLTIASELAFTFYIHAYGFSNLVGHFLKIVSFYLIYKALIETGLRQPYNLLFRELKQREAALEESEKRYKAIFENTGAATMIMAEDATISLVNTEFEKLTGFSKAEVEGRRHWTDLVADKDIAEPLWHMDAGRSAPGSPVREYEAKIADKQGNLRDVHVMVSPIPGTRQNVASAIDITDLKRAQKIILRDKETLEEMVRHRTQELVDAHKKLSEAKRLSGIGMLAAAVAHELRNPLGVIQTALYNVGRKRKEPAIDRHLANIEKKIAESNQIITNLLRYSRIKPPKRERTDLSEILTESMASAQGRFTGRGTDLIADLGPIEGVFVKVDTVQINEVLDNVLNNAYQAVADVDGRIEIKSWVMGNSIHIRVRDNGEGIDPGDLENIFEPFFTRKPRGTGLGLTICRELVQLHGGTIDVESTRGSGTTVSVTLPLE